VYCGKDITVVESILLGQGLPLPSTEKEGTNLDLHEHALKGGGGGASKKKTAGTGGTKTHKLQSKKNR